MKPIGLLIAFGWILSNNVTVVTFDSGPVGQAPQGWSIATSNHGLPPRWQILQDRSAPTQPYVLAQTSSDRTEHFPLAILDGLSLKDADISVRIKPVSGKEDRAGGVVWRYRDPENYYLARINALTHNVVVYKMKNGFRYTVAAPADHDFPVNGWSILKVSARGDRFQVFIDHRRILQCWDRTFGSAGKVGLATEADSVTYFDDFRVYPK